MTIGSLFSGIGGLELGLERAGLGPVLWQCEIDPGCRAVLAHHWPDTERYEDVTTLRGSTLSPVDLICGGFPCQDVSSAGGRVGLSGPRSGLWYQFARIVEECRPRWVVVENVASGARAWVDAVRGGLGQLGYATLPIPIAASDSGALHERARVFILAHAHGDREPALPVDGQVVAAQAHGRGDGAERQAAHARSVELRIESGGGEQGRSPAPEPAWAGGGWAEPDVVRVVHGLPRGVDAAVRRRASLGNCVVPQSAEVVGRVIVRLLREAARTDDGDDHSEAA